jgi:triacylglycerol lipase
LLPPPKNDQIDPEPSEPVYPDPPRVADGSGAPYPIVLAHGMFGFQKIQLLGLEYWNGVVEDLATIGEKQVFAARVPPINTVAERAGVLAAFVDHVLAKTGKRKVILIGHSQGGLDSRHLISSLGYGDRVAALVTISTPHHGSRIADLVLGLAPKPAYDLLSPLLDLYGILAGQTDSQKELEDSLHDLSQSWVDGEFNPSNPDDPRVLYFSWAGRSNGVGEAADCDGALYPDDPSKRDAVNTMFAATGAYLSSEGAPAHAVNDGLVSVHSARHGVFLGCVPADHLDEVGQLGKTAPDPATGFWHKAFFRQTVAFLRARNL